MSALEKSLKSKSFWIGFVAGAFLIWAVFVREPFLTSLEDKGSYAYGQQMGTNLKKGFIDYNSRIVRMGMDHASRDHSKLDEKEKQAGLQHLQEKSMPLRQKAAAQQPPVASPSGQADDLGFIETPFQFSYLKSTWKEFVQKRKNLDNPRFREAPPEPDRPVDFNSRGNNPEALYSFVLKSYDIQELGTDRNSRAGKSYKLRGNELPQSLQFIISAMKPKETWLVKIKSLSDVPPGFSWPSDFSEGKILEIQRN
jgi:hypothetical protein